MKENIAPSYLKYFYWYIQCGVRSNLVVLTSNEKKWHVFSLALTHLLS